MKNIIFITLLAVFVNSVQSADEVNGESAFDFWIGEWDLEWENPDGTTATGSNHVRRILDGKVIEENFEALSGDLKGFKGKSYSVYNPATDSWKQTWVDNQGAYLDFTGEVSGDTRIFQREARDREGKEIVQRMVFYDITNRSLTWDWELSEDGGETWQLRWRIFYQRK